MFEVVTVELDGPYALQAGTGYVIFRRDVYGDQVDGGEEHLSYQDALARTVAIAKEEGALAVNSVWGAV